jgi:superfamily II DNA or RNA helicase
MIDVVVDNRVRLRGELPSSVDAEIRTAFTYPNPKVQILRAIGKSVWNVPKTIETWGHDEDGTLTLPRGGMPRVRAILRDTAVPYRVLDRRTEGSFVKGPLVYSGHALWDHQRLMKDAALKKENCIVRAATGGGKTEAAFAMVAAIGLNTIVIVPTSELFEQWQRRAAKTLGIDESSVGFVRASKKKLRQVTIAMQATLGNGVSEELREFFGAVIVDEVQRAPAATLYKAIDAFPARYRIGVSASEKRKDRMEFVSYDLFGDVAFEASRADLTRDRKILDVEFRLVPTGFSADWYGGGRGGDYDFNRLLDEMTADPARTELAIQVVLGEVRAGARVLVLTHRREHAREIRADLASRGVRCGLMLGDSEPGDAEEFARTRQGIERGMIRVGVGTYGALGYGIDIPAATVGVAVTPLLGNEQTTNQVRGRLCRLDEAAGKERGRLYILWDEHVYGREHAKNAATWNASSFVRDRATGRWVDLRKHLGMGPARHKR